MLTSNDKTWIQSNRTELIGGRTTSVSVTFEIMGAADPFTGEKETSTTTESVDCIWHEIHSIAKEQRSIVDGVTVKVGDIEAKFPITADIPNAKDIVKDTVHYRIVSVNRVGLGEDNRYITLLRRVT